MSDRREQRLPEDLAEVGELLRESRTQLSPLELDQIKLHAKERARRRQGLGQLRRGVNVRSRGVTAILTLLLIGGTTAGGIAGGSGSSSGDSASNAQYRPPKCTKDMRVCVCPKGQSLQVVNGQIVCGPATPPPPPCNSWKCNHGHHHHHSWRQGHNGHWQWCDNDRDWHDWSGRDDDW